MHESIVVVKEKEGKGGMFDFEEEEGDFYSENEGGERSIISRIDFLNEIIQSPLDVKASGIEISKPLKKRKTSSVIRKKVSPSRHGNPPDNYANDERVREKIRFICSVLADTRPYLKTRYGVEGEEIYKWTIDFLSERGYWSTKTTKDKFLISLYATMMACRLRGIFFDSHLLAMDLGIPYKLFQKGIFECSPPATSSSELDKKLVKLSLEADKYELIWEYINILRILVPDIPDSRIESYKSLCRLYFERLSHLGVCDDEKQFCVTADKVFIYGIFEIIKVMNPEKTEKAICEQLSVRFSIPRVTIEKMKRLVNKIFKKVSPENNFEVPRRDA